MIIWKLTLVKDGRDRFLLVRRAVRKSLLEEMVLALTPWKIVMISCLRNISLLLPLLMIFSLLVDNVCTALNTGVVFNRVMRAFAHHEQRTVSSMRRFILLICLCISLVFCWSDSTSLRSNLGALIVELVIQWFLRVNHLLLLRLMILGSPFLFDSVCSCRVSGIH